MEPFPNSKGCEYILVIVDYVSKWGGSSSLLGYQCYALKEDVT
jgi:hypothetical protein